MNGRMYDPLVGRFLSADNYIPDEYSTQLYNRYSYCLNNPLRYSDPSGWLMAPIDQYRDLGHSPTNMVDFSLGNYHGEAISEQGWGGAQGRSFGTMGNGYYDVGQPTMDDLMGSLWNATPDNSAYGFTNVNGDWYHTSSTFIMPYVISNATNGSNVTNGSNAFNAWDKSLTAGSGIGIAASAGGTIAGVDDLLASNGGGGLVAGTPWIDAAYTEYNKGIAEIPGAAHNPRIIEYLKSAGLSGDYLKDETGWCASFVHFCLKQADITGAGARPHAYDTWGQSLDGPAYGALAVFKTSHIGFVVGQNGDNLIILHGNWSNKISLSDYIKPSEIQYYRYPTGYMYKPYE
jgi:uncharacterized protein (TIGR02594 family)